MMKIGIAATMDDNAPSYHLRFRSVLNVLQRDGTVQSHDMIRKAFFGRSTRFSLRDETHIILIARVRNLEHLKDIFGFAESREVPVVYETDDHLLYDRRSDAPHEHAREVSAYLKRSACIIASTPYLADELRSFNERVSVFPNLLDPEIWDIRRPVSAGEGKPLRICCIGTGLMSENISLLIPAMELCENRYGGDVVFCLWGNAKYLDAGVKKLKNVTISEKKMPYRAFARKLQHEAFDLGVVPLSDLRFNRAKSNIKYLEYAASGIPSIFSRVEAYAGLHHGDTCLLADNDPDAWIQEIVKMVEDHGLRRRLSERAYDDVSSRFVLNRAWAQNYLSILENVLGRTDAA
jgi:glycosyltransferase involved in cell wall biosynthesis